MNPREIKALRDQQIREEVNTQISRRDMASQAAQASCLGEPERDGFYNADGEFVKYFVAGAPAGSAPVSNPERMP